MFAKKTITALVTAPINQNTALIRVSGPETYSIISSIFDRPLPKYSQKKSQLIFGNVINQKKEIIDQVLLLCFYQPQSFTGEDVVEISCHGNLFLVNQILQLLLSQGAELAEPGEFSKQAFFNDKLSLIQAQAINDLIRAPNLSSVQLALHNLSPQAKNALEDLETKLLEIIATIEVNIDYPEYDGVEYLTGQRVLISLQSFQKELEKIFRSSQQANIYQVGIKVAIVGKPNVGKSTLLNALLQEEKALVSPWAGTTRDVVEGRYNLKGIPLILFDTAGIHSAENLIERMGIQRSRQFLAKAELIFFCLDNSRIWNKEDNDIWQLVKNKKNVIIINKIDLKKRLQLPPGFPQEKVVLINAKQGNIQALEEKIEQLLVKDLGSVHSPYPFLSQSWQQTKLKQLIKMNQEIIQALEEKIPLDVISGDLKITFSLLQELTGHGDQGDLLDIIFSKFCLGK